MGNNKDMTPPVKKNEPKVKAPSGKKMGRPYLEPTEKQKKLLDLIKKNLGKIASGESAVSFSEMMRQAGYSESSARQQTNILIGIQTEIDPLLQKIEDARQDALNRLPTAITRAGYRDLVNGFEALTKMYQLLKGKPTQRTAVDINPESKAYLDEILGENK